jgi:hypothetical protein
MLVAGLILVFPRDLKISAPYRKRDVISVDSVDSNYILSTLSLTIKVSIWLKWKLPQG